MGGRTDGRMDEILRVQSRKGTIHMVDHNMK